VIRLRTAALLRVGAERGWVHRAGRLAGSLHVRRVARDLGMNQSVVSRAYNGGCVSAAFIDRMLLVTGARFEDLFVSDSARVAS